MSATIRASAVTDLNSFDSLVDKCGAFISSTVEIPSSKSGGILGILSDSEGVKLFNNFLCMRSSGHLLDFWFACKGFRTNVDPNNPDKLFQVAKVIYRTYVKSGADHAVPLPNSLKHEISNVVGIDRTLFDSAQENVGSLLEQTFYPEFLDYLKNGFMYGNPSVNRLLSTIFDTGTGDTSSPLLFRAGSPLSKEKSKRKAFLSFQRTLQLSIHICSLFIRISWSKTYFFDPYFLSFLLELSSEPRILALYLCMLINSVLYT
ncbi:unnamed protein product [Echinostoma caproni]|uniref:RGS domain-containing protein n=1 Tax=Echinostoma caproni TaxID=27848 RepID=A0A183A3X0_9TREM|nr:unnamed protein product [Echinostoma caproni]